MTDQNSVDPDATPPFGIGGTDGSKGFLHDRRTWLVGVALAMFLLTITLTRP